MAVTPNRTRFLIFRALVWQKIRGESQESWWLELNLCLACAVTPQSLPFRRFGFEVCFEVQESVFYQCLELAIFGQCNMYCYSRGERNPSVLKQVGFPQPQTGHVFVKAVTPTGVKMAYSMGDLWSLSKNLLKFFRCRSRRFVRQHFLLVLHVQWKNWECQNGVC